MSKQSNRHSNNMGDKNRPRRDRNGHFVSNQHTEQKESHNCNGTNCYKQAEPSTNRANTASDEIRTLWDVIDRSIKSVRNTLYSYNNSPVYSRTQVNDFLANARKEITEKAHNECRNYYRRSFRYGIAIGVASSGILACIAYLAWRLIPYFH